MSKISEKMWAKVEKLAEILEALDGSIIGRAGYTCGICKTKYSGWAAKAQIITKGMDMMRCKKCKTFICPDCCKTEKSVEKDLCPKCGGKLCFPLWY